MGFGVVSVHLGSWFDKGESRAAHYCQGVLCGHETPSEQEWMTEKARRFSSRLCILPVGAAAVSLVAMAPLHCWGMIVLHVAVSRFLLFLLLVSTDRT